MLGMAIAQVSGGLVAAVMLGFARAISGDRRRPGDRQHRGLPLVTVRPGNTMAAQIALQFQGAATPAPDVVPRLPRGHPPGHQRRDERLRPADRPPDPATDGGWPDELRGTAPHGRLSPVPAARVARRLAELLATLAALLAVVVLAIVIISVAEGGTVPWAGTFSPRRRCRSARPEAALKTSIISKLILTGIGHPDLGPDRRARSAIYAASCRPHASRTRSSW